MVSGRPRGQEHVCLVEEKDTAPSIRKREVRLQGVFDVFGPYTEIA